MKKIILFSTLLFLAISGFAQKDSIPEPPYKRFPGFPPINLLLPDSVTHFTKANVEKKKAVLLILFNPGCDHCRHETEEILKNIESFKDIQIIMATNMPFDTMTNFIDRYKLNEQKGIVVGQDTHYFMPGFFMIRNLPFLAFYDKKKNLLSTFEGSMPIPSILEIFKKDD